MVNHEWLTNVSWILVLNKKDKFEQKLQTTSLQNTYSEYCGNGASDGVAFIEQLYRARVVHQSVQKNLHSTVVCSLDAVQIEDLMHEVSKIAS